MDVKRWFLEAVEILKLDEDAIRRAAADPTSTGPAVLFLVVAGAAWAVGSPNPIGLPIGLLLVFSIGFPIMAGLAVLVWWLIATFLCGAKASYSEVFRPIALAHVVQFVAVVPYAGPVVAPIASIYQLVVDVVAIRTVSQISTGKAVAVVLIPTVLCYLCASALAVAWIIASLAGVSV